MTTTPSPIEFAIPDELKQYGVTRIVQVGPFIKTQYKGLAISSNFDVNKLKSSMKEFREEAGKIITSNGVDASEIIEKIASFIVNETTSHYEKSMRDGTFTAATAAGNGKASVSGSFGNNHDDNKQTQATTVMKYTVKKQEQLDGQQTPLSQLWETVKIGGRFHLVSYDSVQNKLVHTSEISEESRIIQPYMEDGGVEPYSFQSLEELQQCIQLAKMYSAGTLFRKVKEWAKAFYDTDTDEYINLIAADIIFTYFQDRIGKTHYIFVWGEPDQGKGAILETFNQLAYRGASITSATAATVYRMLGSVEKGQVTLIIDEANKLENDDFLLNVLKAGYKGNVKIPRVMDAQSSEHNKIEWFYAYCFKIIAAEHLPAQWKTGGFLSRCLQIKTAPGNPEIDIGDVVDNAGDVENAKVMNELTKLRKLLFAFRLLHFSEPIPDVKIKGIIGRDRELIKPLIRLFRTHGSDDSESFETIKQTLHYFIKERNKDKGDSFSATILNLVRRRIEDYNGGRPELTYKEIRDCVKEQLNGESIDDKPGTIKTDLFGEVGTRRLTATLHSLGGKSDRDASGDKRIWKFDVKTLNRFSRVYKQIPDEIELEEQTTLDSDDMAFDDGAMREQDDREEEEDDND